jgi:alpha-galactosidase/6-phospho-beta-glucosidase family protein
MAKRFKVVLVGGGSVLWSPTLINDMMLKDELREAQYVVLDIDRKAGERIATLGKMIAAKRGLGCTWEQTANQRKAFDGADAILITVSTGGFDSMAHDLAIPEKYQIYQTVGDTVGPGGWARGLRNIPVFARMAMDIRELAPEAWVLNYTNPMGTLTQTLNLLTNQPVVGLCHGVFEVYAVLRKIFKLESDDDIKVNFGGMNHFFWIMNFRIKGRDGYAMLRAKLRSRSFPELISEAYEDAAGFSSRYWLAAELYNQTGYLPYFGDRHSSEFISGYLNIDEKRLERFNLERTSIEFRRERHAKRGQKIDDMIAGKAELPPEKSSRETAADITATRASGGEFIDVVNVPNRGQIANLPLGTVVETMGVVNAMGFTPLTVGELPAPVYNLVRPHAENQNLIVDAMCEGDKEKAMQALLNDPLCSHLPKSKIREMGEELLKAHAALLPKPFGTAARMNLA